MLNINPYDIIGFLTSGFPWISQIPKLEIHFKKEGFELTAIDNFFASLFSLYIYLYAKSISAYELSNYIQWYVFAITGFLIVVGYLYIYIHYKEKVRLGIATWPIYVNFVLYSSFFCCLTASSGILKVYENYHVIKGRTYNHEHRPIDATCNILFKNAGRINFLTDKKGNFCFPLHKDSLKQIQIVIFNNHVINEEYSLEVNGESAMYTKFKEIVLKVKQ